MSLTSSIVAAYRFSNGALTTDSKASYTLTNVNSIANSSDGISGYCADAGTTNTTKYLYRSDAYGMTGASAKSYSFWWKTTATPGTGVQQQMWRHLYGGSAVGNYANLGYRESGGNYQLIMNSSPNTATYNQTLTVGTWYHFVITVPANNTGNLTCYMNGSSIFTIPNWSQNYALTTQLGMFSDHGGGSISPGELDEFYVFNEVLSAGDITTLASNTDAGFYPFPTTAVKSVDGLAYASVKSKNGLAVASIKSFNGLA